MSIRTKNELTPEQIADMLDCLDPDGDHDQWKQIGMAIHDWDSTHTGKDLWLQWSQGGEKFDSHAEQAINSSWKGFRAGKGISVGTLVKMAMDNGYRFPKLEGNNDSYPRRIAQKNAEKRKADEQQKQEWDEQQKQGKARNHDKAAAIAVSLFSAACLVDLNFPYLVSHGLNTPEIRVIQVKQINNAPYGYGHCLVIPLFNETGHLRNLEFIKVDGSKRPVPGGQKNGLFHPIRFNNPTWTIYICEGWATGVAIHLNKSNHPTVMCAMGKGNLWNVIEIVLRKFPENRIVLAADNDEAGIKVALEVAKRFGLEVALPPTPGDDFCDIHIRKAKGNKTT